MSESRYNNTPLALAINMSNFAALYDLPNCVHRIQFRREPGSAIELDFLTGSVGPTSIIFDAPSCLVIGTAHVPALRNLFDDYHWEYGFTPPGGEYLRIDGGVLTFLKGINP